MLRQLSHKPMKSNRIRLIILAVIVSVALVLSSFRLMQYQIVGGAEYREQANTKTISTVRVKAARGEILDRYGRPLAINKVGFNIVFDRAFMPKDEQQENTIIVKLMQMLEKSGEDWLDDMPITDTKPYQFEEGRDDDVKQLKSKLRLNTYATAQNCIDQLVEEYKIEGYDDKLTRKIAGVRYEMLRTEFSLFNRYTFAEDVSTSTVARVKEMNYDLPGVDIVEEAIRDYVSGTTAPHIIGSIGPIYAETYEKYKKLGYPMNATVGISGIESAMESYLRGTDGIRQVEQNAKGDVINVVDKQSTVPGNNVMLTIDKVFQDKVQKILADSVKGQSNAKGGAISVLDVKTGEVLAIATYPSYNINDLKKNAAKLNTDKTRPLYNRALQATYRPGSTFKTAVATGALAEGVINSGSTVYCGQKYHYYTGYTPGCTGFHRNIAVSNALTVSCNIFFYDVGRRLGISKIGEYAHKLGLATETGLELPNAVGTISSPEVSEKNGRRWEAADVVQASIGQLDNYVTPLQMSIQAATIANKGVRYESHIVKSIQSYNFDKLIKETTPVVASKIDVNPSMFDPVREGMEGAARRVTGVNRLTNLSFKVAIKTGTPQTATKRYNSTVIGFAPSEEPEIAIAGIIEDGERASNLVRQIINAYYNTKKPTQQKPQSAGTLLP